MAGFFSRARHGRRAVRAARSEHAFEHALGIAHRWFLDRVGHVATIQYVTAPVDLDWWKKDTSAPLITSGINADGTVALTLHRKFIEFKVTDNTLLPEVLYELLVTEWASLTGQTVAEVDPDL